MTQQDSSLPEVYVAIIDRTVLRQVVADITTHAEVLDVALKGAPGALAKRGDLAAVASFVADDEPLAATGIQLRYRHAQQTWNDTITRAGADSFRLVRMAEVAPVLGSR